MKNRQILNDKINIQYIYWSYLRNKIYNESEVIARNSSIIYC